MEDHLVEPNQGSDAKAYLESHTSYEIQYFEYQVTSHSIAEFPISY